MAEEIREVRVNARPVAKGDSIPVTMQRTAAQPTSDQALWAAIRNRTKAIGFERYSKFISNLFCEEKEGRAKALTEVLESVAKSGKNPLSDSRLSLNAVDTYNVLKLATEVFLLIECGVVKGNEALQSFLLDKLDVDKDEHFDVSEESMRFGRPVTEAEIIASLSKYLNRNDALPYLNRILDALLGLDEEGRKEKLPYCDGILQYRFSCPSMIELIWSYWHEEGMLAQTMNAISLRFQNRRAPGFKDPMAQLEIDPLRPLNNIIWGYIQNEYNRLTVSRRAYEYDHHYGLTLYGKAVPKLRSADSRSKFLEAFHNLLYRASIFYKEDQDTTVVADAFPLLTALRECHIILAEGAHNQFGDLPWTARVEMMMEQWTLARPEMQEFLRGRPSVPYKETWMGRVDAMKKVQGWTDTTITHFNDLAVYGEQMVLSVRYGDWIDVNDENQAKNWARYWKPEIQSYIHAYRAVTGVDLTSSPVDSTPPWVHLKNQEERRQKLAA